LSTCLFGADADGETLHSEKTAWGLIDYDRQGDPCGVEIWSPAKMFPADLLDAIPEPPPIGPEDA
jgi:hypothetical protein